MTGILAGENTAMLCAVSLGAGVVLSACYDIFRIRRFAFREMSRPGVGKYRVLVENITVFAEDIVFEANKLTLLVERLLLLARIDNNRQKLDKKETDLHSVIDNVISAQSEFAIQKNITFQVELGQAYKMFADEALITSAIGNLVNNAIKYGIAGGYVKISAFDSDDGINITIKDNGIGISKENIDKIWTRFFKIDDVRNDEYGSCGMGLSMVKSIIDLHDGKIDVNSVFGEGTEFTIILPNR